MFLKSFNSNKNIHIVQHKEQKYDYMLKVGSLKLNKRLFQKLKIRTNYTHNFVDQCLKTKLRLPLTQ